MKEWFAYLDTLPQRKEEDLSFTEFGPKLASQGFRRLSQLAQTSMKVEDLKNYLEVDLGTADLIFGYAQEDILAIRNGELVIPVPQV